MAAVSNRGLAHGPNEKSSSAAVGKLPPARPRATRAGVKRRSVSQTAGREEIGCRPDMISARNPKSDDRNPKEIRNPKSEVFGPRVFLDILDSSFGLGQQVMGKRRWDVWSREQPSIATRDLSPFSQVSNSARRPQNQAPAADIGHRERRLIDS